MIIPCRSFGFFLQPRKRWNYEVACFCKVLVFCGCFSASWDEYFAGDAGQVFVTLEPPPEGDSNRPIIARRIKRSLVEHETYSGRKVRRGPDCC
jgi:hypothetical protein